jgi:hypothetical protein
MKYNKINLIEKAKDRTPENRLHISKLEFYYKQVIRGDSK